MQHIVKSDIPDSRYGSAQGALFAFVKETAHASVFGFQNQRVVSAAVAVFERSEENC